LRGIETVPDDESDGDDVEIKIDGCEICEKSIDGWGEGPSKDDWTTFLDRKDIDFSTSIIWNSSSTLDSNNNEISCGAKDIDFSTSVIWTPSFILYNNGNEVPCQGTNSVDDEEGGQPSAISSILIFLNSSGKYWNFVRISTSQITFSFITMSNLYLVSLNSVENSPRLHIDKKDHPSNLKVSVWFPIGLIAIFLPFHKNI